jgi:hypothetical protein
MKRFYILLAIICFSVSVKAQLGGGTTVVGKISGNVIDSLTKQPLSYATVAIYRSGGKVPLNGVLTDDKGNFKLNDMKIGKYKVSVTFIGYPSKIIDPVITTPEKPDFNMGTIRVAPSGKTLNTVNVTSAASVIETKIDKIVYNAEKDITSAGGNASDVLRKVPLVNVDINGNVSLRGDQNVKVLANNLADVLKSIPADQIKNVEVITSPSAKYDAEGSAGIINIVTKKKNISGISGSVSGGLGTRQNNGNANLNINKNRLSLTGNFGGNFTWPQTSSTISGSSDNAGTYANSATSSTRITRYGYRGSGSLGYDINSFNSFTSDISLNQGGFKADGNSNNTFNKYSIPTAAIGYLSLSNSQTTFGGFDWNNDYVKKFKKDGHQIDIAGEWSHGITDFASTSLYSTNFYKDLRSKNNGVNNEYTLQADYTLPVSDKFKIEAGGKTIVRRIDSEFDNYTGTSNNVNTDADPNTFAFDPTTSNNYNYNQNVYAGYTVLTFTLPKNYGLQLGSRLENTQIDGAPKTSSSALQSFTNSYNVFIPTMILSKTIKSSTFKLSYTKRIQRPSLTYLNPFLNTANQTAYSQGNPELHPEISQYAELNYSTYIGASVINISTYYKHTSDLIESIVGLYPGKDGVTLTTYQNIGTNNSFGSSFFGSINPIKPLTLRGSINAYTYKPDPTGQYGLEQSQNGTYISYNAFMSASVNLKGGWAAESFVILNSPRRTIQGTNPSFSLWIVGVKKEFWEKRASLGFNTFDPFTENKAFNTNIKGKYVTQFSNTEFPFRSFGVSFSYNFGKMSFSAPQDPTQQKKKGVNNDDLKQDSGNSGGPSGGR